MKANANVQAALQAAITQSLALSARYHLYALDCRRFGYRIWSKLDEFGEDLENQTKKLTKHMFLAGGKPVYSCPEVSSLDDVGAILSDLLKLENQMDDDCADWVKIAQDAGDMPVFHYAQHIALRCRFGDRENCGRIKRLLRELANLKQIGMANYISTQVTK